MITSVWLIPPNLSILAFPQGASCLVPLPVFNYKFSYLLGNHQHLASCSRVPQSRHPTSKLISSCSIGKCFCQTFFILSNLFTRRREVGRAKRTEEKVSSFLSALATLNFWHFLELHLIPSYFWDDTVCDVNYLHILNQWNWSPLFPMKFGIETEYLRFFLDLESKIPIFLVTSIFLLTPNPCSCLKFYLAQN